MTANMNSGSIAALQAADVTIGGRLDTLEGEMDAEQAATAAASARLDAIETNISTNIEPNITTL